MSIRKEIENLIYQKLPLLSSNQKKIADFFLEHIDLVALLPIKDIAQKVNVSEASIVRFGQLLGYKGYKELKQELSAALKNQLSPTQRYQHAISEKEKIPDTLKLASDSVIRNIHETIKSLDKDVFAQIVNRIISAQRIYCLGLEISAHLSQLMTFLLRLYSYDAQYFSMDFFRYQEQIGYLNKNDLLIAFSFSPYSRETIDALAMAKERGIKSIAFTDKKTSPIRSYATYCIQIKTDNIMFSNSLGAVVTVINAIINELNFKDQKRTLHALQIIEESIKDERYFINPEK
jgi:DNA-binding MurR/RpiR family transcriptional regulator